MAKPLVVIDKTDSTSFLQDDDTSTFIIVSMTHNKRGSCSVERLGMGIISEHSTQCKGHSKGCRLLMWWGVFGFFFTISVKSIFIMKMRFKFR
jgi:hypothetical protein